LTERHLPIKAFNMANRRMIERISPLWLGIGISGSLIVILLVTEIVLGRWDALLAGGKFDPLASVSSGILRDLRIAIVHCLLIGYLPAAFLHVVRSGRRTVFVLQGALGCTREECKTLAASIRLSTRGLVITGLIGLVLSFAVPFMVPPVPLTPWSPSTWSPEVAWHRILGPATAVWAWWLGYAIVTVSVRMSRIAKKLNQLDLFDLSPLAPFTQQGLTNALLLVGSLSIWSLMMFETGFGQMTWIIVLATLVMAVLALLSPVHGVHKRIRQSKEDKLRWANGEISKQRSSFQNSDTSRWSGKMADLVAYRGLVESVPEWPFTISTYTRLILYTLLPLVTWGIGLVAEEFLGRVFH
jgi:hypothetical protein